MKRVLLGISCGDPNGIGLEVALRAFADARMFKYFAPVVFASEELVAAHQEANGLEDVTIAPARLEHLAAAREEEDDVVRVVTAWEHEPPVEFGRVSEEAGAVAKTSLEQAAAALREKQVDILVTAPINKSAMQQAGFGYPGHTEYLESEFGNGKSLMVMVGADDLRVAVATGHIPLKSVASSISPTILQNKIALFDETLRRDFGVDGPLIAVLGLNPHAGDEGAIGTEEESTIRPAVEAAKAKGMRVMGPYPADGFFGSGRYRDFDGVLAMYHDQGLVPFKTLSFGGGVNYTAGLSAVRTSPDHGTALDIAGRGKASAASFTEACFLARAIQLTREGFDEAHANPLQFRKHDRKRRGDKRDGRGGDRRGGGAGGRKDGRRDGARQDGKGGDNRAGNEGPAPGQTPPPVAKTLQPKDAPRAAERPEPSAPDAPTGRPAPAGSAEGGHPEGTPPSSE